MRIVRTLIGCVVAAAAYARCAGAAEPIGNPILPGADPHAMVIGDRVWIFPTFSVGREAAFYAFDSADLSTWRRHGPILRFADVAWINGDGRAVHYAWAPCVVERDRRFFFYYSVGDQRVQPSRIGVAVGDGPAGPFVDSGRPLATGPRDHFEAIDPMVFADPKDGKAFLYAGGSDGATLRVFELNADMVSIARRVDVATPPRFTEGAFVHERDGVYYLSYSHGGWRDASYSVHYATAPSPTGPWTYRGAILTSDATHKAPGHHSFLVNRATGDWFVVYHRWSHQTGDGPYRGRREVCIDRLEYDADGLIKPIVMTDAGVMPESFATTRPAVR